MEERLQVVQCNDQRECSVLETAGALAARTALRCDHRATNDADMRQERAVQRRATIEALAALEQAAFAVTKAAERARTMAEMLGEALSVLAEANDASTLVPPFAHPSLHDIAPVSPREHEVLALVAQGYSNKMIAETLYVSPKTIKTHVASLLHKLQADTRVQLAAIATKRELQYG